jgi:hypothetical protein
MANGPLARAFVQILSNADRVGEDIRDALGDAAESIERNFREAAASIRRHMGGSFDATENRASAAARSMFEDFAAAARLSEGSWDGVGGDAFADIVVEAASAADAAAASFLGAAGISEQALETIGGDAFVKVAAEAELSAADIAAAFSASTAAVNAEMDAMSRNARREFAQIAAASAAAAAGGGGVAASLAAANAVPEKHFSFLKRQSSIITQAAATSSFFALTAGAAGFLAIGAKISAEFERIELGIQNIVASQRDITFEEAHGGAQLLLNDIKQLALQTPFSFKGLAENVQQLLASGRDMSTVIEDMRSLGGVAALVGADPGELHFVIRALGQIQSSTKVYQQDLNQIIQRLPGFNARVRLQQEIMRAYPEDAKNMAAANRLIMSGFISGAEGVDLLLAAMNRLPGAQDALEVFQRSLIGQFERLKEQAQFGLKDGFQPVVDFIQDTGALGNLADIIRDAIGAMGLGVSEMVEDVFGPLTDTVERLGPIIGSLIQVGGAGLGALLDALTPGLDALAAFLDNNQDQLDDLLESIGELAGDVITSGLEIFLGLLDALLPALQVFVDILDLIPDELLGVIATFLLLRNAFVGADAPLRLITTGFTKVLDLAGRISASTIDVAGAFAAPLTNLNRQQQQLGAINAILTPGLQAEAGAANAAATATQGAAVAFSAAQAATLGLIAGLGLIFIAWSRHQQAVADYRQEIEQLEDGFTNVIEGTSTLNAELQDFLKDNWEELGDDSRDALAKAGISMKSLTRDIVAGRDSLDGLRRFASALELDFGGVDISELKHGLGPGRAFNDDLETLAGALGISHEELSDLIDEMENYDDQAVIAAKASLGWAVTSGKVSQATVDAAVASHGWVGALKELGFGLDGTSLELSAAKSLIDDVADGTAAAEKVFDSMGQQLEKLFDASALSRAHMKGLDDEVRSLAKGIAQGGISTVDELGTALDNLGISAVDSQVAVDAAIETIEKRLESANKILDRISFGPALGRVDEFNKGLESSFKTGEGALRAFSINYKTMLQGIIDETENVRFILSSNVGPLQGFLEAIVREFQGTGPDGALMIAGIADLIKKGKLEQVEKLIAPLAAKITELGGVIDVNLLAAIERGDVKLDDLASGLDGIAAKALGVSGTVLALEQAFKGAEGHAARAGIQLDEGFFGGPGAEGASAAAAKEADKAVTTYKTSVTTGLNQAKAELAPKAEEVSSAVVEQISQGIVSGIPGLIAEIQKATSSASVAAYYGGAQVGGQFAQGILDGLNAKIPEMASAAVAAAVAMKAAVQFALGIFSPSRVGIELGAHFGEGLALGIASMRPDVAGAADRLAQAAAGGIGVPGVGGSGAAAGASVQDNRIYHNTFEIRSPISDARPLSKQLEARILARHR